MTLRELLTDLQAQGEKYLDAPVLVSPHSGGYSGVSHVSVMYVGNVVIHLLDAPKLTDRGREFQQILKRK
jgi:hypothetical protein